MKGHMKSGVFLGAGAAVTIETGFIPTMVVLSNPRGATEAVSLWTNLPVLAFDSGSDEILKGDVVTDATAGGSFTVASITVTSGTWAGGDAAGYMELLGETGTITNNNELNVLAGENRGALTGAATIDGSVIYFDVDIDSEVGTPASRFVVAYQGTTTASAGFTISAGAAVSSEWISWVAFGADE